jgi:cytochrome c-type biogenesis protein CcmH/NrfG
VTGRPELDHTTVYELLPWLANGSLAAAERDGAELHVRSCIVCRRELKELERLRQAVRSQPTLHLSAESGLDRLQRQLDREAASRPVRRDAGYVPFFRFAAVASVGIAFLGVLLWLAPGVPNQAGYATLATQPAAQRAQIDLIFDQHTAVADIQALLQTVDGEIVAGPSGLGRYGVRIHGGSATDAEVATLIEKLARDPRVRFAGRAFTENTR